MSSVPRTTSDTLRKIEEQSLRNSKRAGCVLKLFATFGALCVLLTFAVLSLALSAGIVTLIQWWSER